MNESIWDVLQKDLPGVVIGRQRNTPDLLFVGLDPGSGNTRAHYTTLSILNMFAVSQSKMLRKSGKESGWKGLETQILKRFHLGGVASTPALKAYGIRPCWEGGKGRLPGRGASGRPGDTPRL